jgi:hypothetical protein
MVRQIPLKVYTDTYTYSLFLLSIVKHHSSWSSFFICGCNEKGFMRGIPRRSFYWHSRRFSEGPNRKYHDLVRMSRRDYKHVCSLLKVRNISNSCWVFYYLNDVILILFVVKNTMYVLIYLNKGLDQLKPRLSISVTNGGWCWL